VPLLRSEGMEWIHEDKFPLGKLVTEEHDRVRSTVSSGHRSRLAPYCRRPSEADMSHIRES
jgi:hypothetical protein